MIDIGNEEIAFLESWALGIEDLEHVSECYDIGRLKRVHMHFEKTANINMLIETSRGKYVAKFLHTEHKRFMNIIDYLENIQSSNVPVVLPLRNLNGDYLTRIKEYNVQLTPYIAASPFLYTRKHMLSSGQILQKLHSAVKDDFQITDPPASVYPSVRVFNESRMRIEALKGRITDKQISMIDSLYASIVEKWEEQAGGLPLTIIHGDWRVENLLFTEKGDVCAVLDFDFIQRKERLFDIAYALHNLSEFWNNSIINYFLKGYGHLTEQELKIINLAVARVSFFFLCTASFSKNAVLRINEQLQKQLPIIENVLSNCGKANLINICKPDK